MNPAARALNLPGTPNMRCNLTMTFILAQCWPCMCAVMLAPALEPQLDVHGRTAMAFPQGRLYSVPSPGRCLHYAGRSAGFRSPLRYAALQRACCGIAGPHQQPLRLQQHASLSLITAPVQALKAHSRVQGPRRRLQTRPGVQRRARRKSGVPSVVTPRLLLGALDTVGAHAHHAAAVQSCTQHHALSNSRTSRSEFSCSAYSPFSAYQVEFQSLEMPRRIPVGCTF